MRLTAGNEQLLALYNRRDELAASIDRWRELAEQIDKRWPAWMTLKRLMAHVDGVEDADILRAQVKTIEQQRQLLEEPDLITPLVASLTQLLRKELNEAKAEWDRRWAQGEARLRGDENWESLEPEQKHTLRVPHQLVESATPKIEVESPEAVLRTLDALPLSALKDRIAALLSRYDQIVLSAARLVEPEAQEIQLPRRMLKSSEDVDSWLDEVRVSLGKALEKGPVVIK
jgi:hypothetical protein